MEQCKVKLFRDRKPVFYAPLLFKKVVWLRERELDAEKSGMNLEKYPNL